MNPSLEDSGSYECQISYHDDTEKKLKIPFTLEVLGKRHLQRSLFSVNRDIEFQYVHKINFDVKSSRNP